MHCRLTINAYNCLHSDLNQIKKTLNMEPKKKLLNQQKEKIGKKEIIGKKTATEDGK